MSQVVGVRARELGAGRAVPEVVRADPRKARLMGKLREQVADPCDSYL